MVIRFGVHEVDREARRLRGPDGAIHVEPQVFDVLVHLIANRDRVVTKEELLDEVWQSRFVSESALTSRIKQLRAAVGDSGRDQHTVRTVHGTGYQFVAAVHEVDAGEVDGPTPVLPVDVLRHVPKPSTSFLGRGQEGRELSRLLADERLVTVLGPGGTGKTRLTIEYANALPADESAVFLDLAAVRDGGALGQALASALGIEAGMVDDVVDACCSYLRSRAVLLIVDNCEHVVVDAAGLVRRVLDAVPSSTILATSRVPLGLADELLYRLHPLPVPLETEGVDAQDLAAHAAVALFVDRVRRIDRDFALDDRSAPVVVALCGALDGMPLALELAAARTAVLSLPDLAARLDRRLDLLAAEGHDLDERHRTLRATLDWSYDLLDEECRTLFRHLSVFPSGLALDAVEWVGERLALPSAAIPALEGLVAASLVDVVERASGRRYVQLETMRAFGLDQLEQRGELAAAEELAGDWVADLLGRQVAEIMTSREHHWDDRIRQEIPNIRATRTHHRSRGDRAAVLAISRALDEWSRLRDVSELWAWVDQLAEEEWPDATSELHVRAMAAQAAWRRGRIADAERLACAILDDRRADEWARMRAHSALGVSLLFQGRFQAAADEWERRAVADGYFIDLGNAAVALAYDGQTARAAEVGRVVHERSRQAGWPSAIAWSEYARGEVASVAGSGDATEMLEAAVADAREVGSAFTVGVASVTLCTMAVARGDLVDGAHRYADLVDHWLRSGTWTQLWTTLRHAAALLSDRDPEVALLVLEKAELDPYAPKMDLAPRRDTAALRAALVGRLGSDRAAEVRAAARSIDRAALADRARRALSAS